MVKKHYSTLHKSDKPPWQEIQTQVLFLRSRALWNFLHPPPPPPHFKSNCLSISPVKSAFRLLFLADEQVAILCIKRDEFVKWESKSGDYYGGVGATEGRGVFDVEDFNFICWWRTYQQRQASLTKNCIILLLIALSSTKIYIRIKFLHTKILVLIEHPITRINYFCSFYIQWNTTVKIISHFLKQIKK